MMNQKSSPTALAHCDLILSYDFSRLLIAWKPLPAMIFMAGNDGGWVVMFWVFEDRF